MKTVKTICQSLALSAALSVSFSVYATPSYDLNDNYIGGDDHGYSDVIGHDNLFNTHGLNVSVSNNSVTIDIFTNFANTNAIGSYSGLTRDGRGIGSGDLFLSNTYTPYDNGSAGYLDDNASNGNFWTYGLAIDDPFSTEGGSAILYALEGNTNDDNALLSEDYLNRGIFRNGQEVAVDDTRSPQDSTIREINTTGLWDIDLNAQKISFMFDTTGTNLLDSGSLAVHWAMLCGNDVIEGSVDLPTHVNEPSTLALLGLGLFGLAASRRRISKIG